MSASYCRTCLEEWRLALSLALSDFVRRSDVGSIIVKKEIRDMRCGQ